MKRAQQDPRAHSEELCGLYRKLQYWWAMGHLEESAYVLGLHLLQKMARLGSLEVPGTWAEFASQVVTRGEEMIAGPAASTQYLYLGALQQLHSVAGLFSHVNQDGIERSKEEARVNSFISHHFTKEPGIDPDLIGEHTPMLFVYVTWAGYDVDKTWEQVAAGNVRKVGMPSWLKVRP